MITNIITNHPHLLCGQTNNIQIFYSWYSDVGSTKERIKYNMGIQSHNLKLNCHDTTIMLFISYGNISMLAKKTPSNIAITPCFLVAGALNSRYEHPLFLGCWCFEQQTTSSCMRNSLIFPSSPINRGGRVTSIFHPTTIQKLKKKNVEGCASCISSFAERCPPPARGWER